MPDFAGLAVEALVRYPVGRVWRKFVLAACGEARHMACCFCAVEAGEEGFSFENDALWGALRRPWFEPHEELWLTLLCTVYP